MDFVDSGSGSLEVNDDGVPPVGRLYARVAARGGEAIETKVDAVVEALEREDVDELWPARLRPFRLRLTRSLPTHLAASCRGLELDFDEGSGRAVRKRFRQ